MKYVLTFESPLGKIASFINTPGRPKRLLRESFGMQEDTIQTTENNEPEINGDERKH